jgi:hypothetical protein
MRTSAILALVGSAIMVSGAAVPAAQGRVVGNGMRISVSVEEFARLIFLQGNGNVFGNGNSAGDGSGNAGQAGTGNGNGNTFGT